MLIDKKFIDLFIKSTERAAYGASLQMGKNDKKLKNNFYIISNYNQNNNNV